MTGLLPILEELSSMPSYRERADWLKRLPFMVVLMNRAWLKRQFKSAKWHEAADYVDSVALALSAVREPDGMLASGYGDMLLVAGRRLDESAKAREWVAA